MSEPVGNSPRGDKVPSNSYKVREDQEQANEPTDKVEKIVEGTVVRRKQPWWKRAARSLVAEDAQNIGDYILVDVFVPALKNLIRDIVVGGTDRTLFGSSRNRRGMGLVGSVTSLRTRYDRMSEPEPRRLLSREARARHDFDEVILDDRQEAIDVIEGLIIRLEKYGKVSVADLYDLCGVTGSFADRGWGWTDLRTADVRQFHGGWLLDLPQPEPLR